MKYALLLVMGLFISFVDNYAQRRPPRDPSSNDAATRASSRQAERGLRQLRNLDVKQTKEFAVDPTTSGFEMYRKHLKEDLGDLAPAEKYLTAYRSFLKLPGTGIAKLNADEKCGQNPDVVSADPQCAGNRLPGGGSAYSFRFDSYRIPRLSDIILQKNVLKTDGFAQQGILVDLGKVPIETVTSESKGLKFLYKFQPASNRTELERSDRELAAGIENDGVLYRLGFFANTGKTFALRSIAFQGSYVRTKNGIPYDEFKFDKRQDVIVVFQVIDMEPNGNITIVWKELSRKDAPNLRN